MKRETGGRRGRPARTAQRLAPQRPAPAVARPIRPRRRDQHTGPAERAVPDPEERLTDMAAPWEPDGGSSTAAPIREKRPSRPKVPGPIHPNLRSTERSRGDGPNDAVQMRVVAGDEQDMRLDRWLQLHFDGIAFSQVQRIIRKGELRVDGKRVGPGTRLVPGQTVRVPPLRLEQQVKTRMVAHEAETRAFLQSITVWEDDDVLVLNKPMGLAVQGGSGTVRHVDGMLAALEQPNGQRPRLVHRIDKDTSGCLLIAKTRMAASELTKTFRSRAARKVYWALVAGVPKLRQGRISSYLVRDAAAEAEGEAKMRLAAHGEEGAVHAVSYYSVVESAARIASWVSLKPVTGRTHQLRAHMAQLGNPIIGDVKYFERQNWELPDGMQNRLHLLARRIVVPHPRTGRLIDVTAPLPAHMRQSWSLLGFDADRYDPIEDAPEE